MHLGVSVDLSFGWTVSMQIYAYEIGINQHSICIFAQGLFGCMLIQWALWKCSYFVRNHIDYNLQDKLNLFNIWANLIRYKTKNAALKYIKASINAISVTYFNVARLNCKKYAQHTLMVWSLCISIFLCFTTHFFLHSMYCISIRSVLLTTIQLISANIFHFEYRSSERIADTDSCEYFS